jgi:hypothetical protein
MTGFEWTMPGKALARLAVLLGIVVAVLSVSACTATQPPDTRLPSPVSSDFFMQNSPDSAFLNSHFSLLGIGRVDFLSDNPPRTTILAAGQPFPPPNLEQNVTVFYIDENVVIYGHVISATPITAICFKSGESGYTRIDYWGPEPFSSQYLTPSTGAIIVGYSPPDFILPTYLGLAPGQYNMKIFAGQTLVAIFPFEVVQ